MAKIEKKSYKLDVALIEKLAMIMCSYEEIAMILDTTVPALKKRYSDIIEKGRSEGKKGLRRKQYEKAVMDGDVRMLIFLGKVYLDQKENPNETDNNEPLPWPVE
jgi:hypothetical protein